MLEHKFSPGFFFSSYGGNESTTFVVNVCGHDSVGWPLARNMDPIAEKYLDEVGLDNLIIPISVSEPKKCPSEYDFSINVVVHSCLTTRIRKSFRLCAHYVEKLTQLSILWIKQECGIQLIEKSCKLLGLQKGYHLKTKESELDQIARAASEVAAKLMEKQVSESQERTDIPKELQINNISKGDTRKPLIKEVVEEKGIKKGFLTGEKSRLYGPEGSKQGSGKTPDPLWHIPESLRNKCTIIDTRDMSVKGPKEGENCPVTQQGSSTGGGPHAVSQPLLSPVCESTIQPGQSNNNSDLSNTVPKDPETWKLVETREEERQIVLSFNVPAHIASMEGVDLEVEPLQVSLDGVVFPIAQEVDPEKVKAKFLKSKKRLNSNRETGMIDSALRLCLPFGLEPLSRVSDSMESLAPVAELPNKTKVYLVHGQTFEVERNYKLLNLVGHGAYGTVCSAVEETTGEKVAVKKVSNVFSDIREGKRVLREMEIMTSLKHRNIIHLHHFFRPQMKETFKDIYLVMDLYDTDLHKIIASRQQLTNEHHQYFMIQAFRGLNYLHEAKVMHRDLKPSNLLVNGDCALAICDFGMARDDTMDENESDLTQYVVTRWYRPPEVLGMGPKQYTNAVDVWSLGLIFAELLVGKALLQGMDYISQLVMIINLLGLPSEQDMEFLGSDAKNFLVSKKFEKPKPFSELFSMATPEAVDLLSHLLVFHPAKRLTAKEVISHSYFEKFRNESLEAGPDQPFVWNHNECTVEELRDKLWKQPKDITKQTMEKRFPFLIRSTQLWIHMCKRKHRDREKKATTTPRNSVFFMIL
eukprot:gene12346-8474_t